MGLFKNESRTLRTLLSQGYKASVVYDIGASNGVWSATIARTLPKAQYHMFEPLAGAVPFYRLDLQKRLARRAQFHLHPVALSDHRGTAEMFATHDGFGSSMLDRGKIPEVKELVRVPSYTLDEFVQNNRLPKPDIMKLDVQGAERLVLTGGRQTLQNVDVLFLEAWLKRGYGPDTPLLTEMIEFLEPAGFSLVDLGEQFRDEGRRVYSVDAVFFSERLLSKS